MPETSKKSLDIHIYWQIFWRRRFFVVIPFVVCLIIGIVLSITTQPEYESSTIVQVSESQLLSRNMQRLIPGVIPRERLNNLRRLIASHNHLKRVIQILNLSEDPRIQELVKKNKDKYPDLTNNEIIELFWIEILRKHISIRVIGNDFIQITASGNTPDLAFNLVKTLTQVFIDESLRREVGGIRGSLEFSTEQLAIYKQKLEDSEERLRKYKEEIVHDELEGKAVASANLDQVNSLYTTTDFDLREAQDQLNYIESQIADLNVNYKLPNNNILNSLKANLLDAILELSQLMLKYSWQDVKILKINSEIEDLREKIKREIEREIKLKFPIGEGANLDLIVRKQIISMEVDFLRRKRDTLSNLSKLFKSQLAKGPSREMTLSRLQREVEANREIYQTLLQNTRGSEIEEALQKTAAEFRFKITEPAIKPIEPVKPKRVRMTMIAAFMGIIIGVSVISLLESIDHSFKNVEDVEKYLNLTVLGTIPFIDMKGTEKI